MTINPEEFEQYLKDPGDPELKALFEEIEICSQQYDKKSNKVKQLCQEIEDLALSIDLEFAKSKYGIFADDE
ncbi:hypothetical protein H6G80_30670 [Nostoc sp. FACHB-87]|uniref:hypothetical protein n=1 Tax=Nostocaceae TaxID=1162 RepID=UPI001683305A|nr:MULTISPECIES: hypothetical protein [Nostocaceae]MBD2458418.1 hypothetical protein [Nostoc sp. FACHB-87]MBD2479486.1 hypothetical protein [Anabaena sp. FACHB-83]